jgi:hypothetical protein
MISIADLIAALRAFEPERVIKEAVFFIRRAESGR